MINKDYIMRMIEQLNLVLSRLLFMKDTREYELMIKEISQSYSQIAGVDPEFIRNLTAESLIKFLSPGERYETEKSIIIGRLLFEEATAGKLHNEARNVINEKIEKAINLLAESYINNPEIVFAKEYAELALRDFPILYSAEFTRRRLSRYFELSGQFSRAEDILYSLLDDGFKEIKQDVVSFYHRIENMSDKQLNDGNLPRSEVKEGLERMLSSD